MDSPSSRARAHHPGFVLVVGIALAAIGLAYQDPVAPVTGTGTFGGGMHPAGLPAFATADSNNSMIAVTGIDVTGASILYLVDTRSKALSVYQATGGTDSMMNLKWVGARKIGLDFEVDGFNDKSKYSYKELAKAFDQNGSSAASSSGVQSSKD